MYLQRAAEYAMGELHELNPAKTNPVNEIPHQSPGSPRDPEKKSLAQSGPQQTLRRMGSMDRKEAIAMARKELVMALYELGMSYLKGWGAAKDKAVAFTYFKIAADLVRTSPCHVSS